jgi:hypothetical protein
MRESVGATKKFPKWKFFVGALGSDISCKYCQPSYQHFFPGQIPSGQSYFFSVLLDCPTRDCFNPAPETSALLWFVVIIKTLHLHVFSSGSLKGFSLLNSSQAQCLIHPHVHSERFLCLPLGIGSPPFLVLYPS